MRKSGVMLHITSLPGPYGVGSMGKCARDFIDIMERNGQSIWQILPVCPTSFGDSPYASNSTFAGNPYLIDLDQLAFDGLLWWDEFQHEQWYTYPDRVDFAILARKRLPVLRKAAWRLLDHKPEDYDQFLKDNRDWLDDYALFMAIKNANEDKAWMDWPEEYKVYDKKKAAKWQEQFKNEIDVYQAIQYLFFRQWHELKRYANMHGIEILGDIPIYVAMDSVDAWSNPELFLMDKKSNPTVVAAVPPDAFSKEGQLWGNPVYDWPYQKKTGYKWWINRIDRMGKLYNILRIDHFRGFDSFYVVQAKAQNALGGKWMKGPGAELFKEVTRKLGPQNIVAEDLGILTPSVEKMLREVGYPGMKVMEFGLYANTTEGQEYLPFAYPANSVGYCGTHDNDTIYGWFNKLSEVDKEYVREYLDSWDPHTINWKMIGTLLASPSDTTIVMAQDLLGLGSESRMNQPGVLAANWQWRLTPGQLSEDTMRHLGYLTRVYRRLPSQRITKKQERREPGEAAQKAADTPSFEQAASKPGDWRL